MAEENEKKYDSSEDTLKHIKMVTKFITVLVVDLAKRTATHDKTKLQEPEKPVFDEYTPKLKGSTYGSEEYKGFLTSMKIALDHHYSNNKHHPEHFKDGIRGMNLVDILEMFCDWKAATMRHENGNLEESVELNKKRFGYSEDLCCIFKNTIELFEK
jgi:hypothetical protein